MANLCCNSVYLLGKPATLKTIRDTIKDLIDSSERHQTTLEKLQERLDFVCEGWGITYDSGLDYFNDDEIEDGKLLIDVCTAWNSVPDYWKALCDKYSLQFSELVDVDGEIFVENDCEKRYFPNEYRLEIWEENDYEFEDDEFESEELLLSYLSTKSCEVHSLEEWMQIFDDEEIGSIKEIERDGQQAVIKCA